MIDNKKDNHIYGLAKWGVHYRKKIVCPACGSKSFVPYVELASGNIVSEERCGRCDRQDKCGYHCTPTEFLKDFGWNAERYKINPERAPKPISTIDNKWLIESTATTNFIENNLIVFLANLFNEQHWLYKYINKLTVYEAFMLYNVGTSNDENMSGGCVFWYINHKGQILTGKIMAYDNTGHRVKSDFSINWVHKKLIGKDDRITNAFNKGSCLFGIHLLTRIEVKPEGFYFNGNKIEEFGIVESEKTAIIASMVKKDTMWFATGGLSNLNYDAIRPIIDFINKNAFLDKKKYLIMLYPDFGAEQLWINKKKEMEHVNILQVHGYEFAPTKSIYQQNPIANEESLEKICLIYNMPKGTDIADWILSEHMTNEQQLFCEIKRKQTLPRDDEYGDI